MTQTTQHAFQAEVQEVLNLMIHSLYSNKEIFLRELVSNASDACDKLRFLSLQDDALLEGDAELHIDIAVDKEKRLLTIRDNGIGMSRDEVMENIGTIARSGTKRFLEQVKQGKDDGNQLIGQFGVGFYSAFIVADHVTVLTRRADAEPGEGVHWSSDGSGEYSIGQIDRPHHGTEVILHLKEDEDEFLQDWTLRSLVNRYSDHIGFPIRMLETPPAADDDGEDAETPAPEWKKVNQASALWTLPKGEISDDDYRSFYKHVSHDFEDPRCWAHNQVEGSQNYTSLLYLPSHAPMDFMMQRDEPRGLKLYVKRVFIMDAAEHLLPNYLRFMRGVVDSDDLPLNVSRELLQDNPTVRKIHAAVVRRSLDLLGKLANDDAEGYQAFWGDFGTVLKEGIVEDNGNRERIAGLLRFTSTQDPEAGDVVSLADYIGRAGDDQDTIWYITAESLAAAKHSPHLEIFRKKGIEVLLMHDRIDEWMMGYFHEFEGKKLRSVAKGDVNLANDTESAEGDDKPEVSEADSALLERMKAALGESVQDVRASQRLTDSAACLVLGEHDMAPHLRRMLEQAGQALPDSKPVLEVNTGHPLVRRLADAGDSDFEDWTHLVHEQAVLAEGGQLDDPASFVARLNRLILATSEAA
ncbi:molecular chaperone HtpG [Marinihelvus fidelis]|uniref:Chaperone protein HtpG n=1 Tax=Marinihelvus fidelis TaxID=2613842 RepID=A0A5N0TB48_9GAMM|nr:molecular chaperone HtpG [Marinihelvus fidelis]KAA9131898.1 molecular chaperone HtpG [Marinihelvus fidelis]